jgi:cell division protein FtsI/penicillin-binding protein 2
VGSEIRQRRVAQVLILGLGAMLASLAGFLVYIQITSSEALGDMASRQSHMHIPILPAPGSILDRNLRVLAMSVDTKSVFADPGVIVDADDVASRLGPLLRLPIDEVYSKITARPDSRFVWLARRVDPGTAAAVRRLNIAGVGMTTEYVRNYPNGQLAANVIGFVGDDGQGLEGLELMFDERLHGKPGESYVRVNRRHQPMWTESDQFVPAQDGQNIVLTLDSTIQAITEESLADACGKFNAMDACAIVMDPKTGAILAMANVPTFDPNHYGNYPVSSRRNICVTDTFPPGSSCKPFVGQLALEAKVVHFGEVIYCESGYWAEAKMHDAGHSYGYLTYEEGMAKSSNIMFGKLGMRLGNERLHDGLARFGFGQRTGVMLPGETTGMLFPTSRWRGILSTTRVAIGQEFSTTPLQEITAFAAISNGGTLLKPKIIRGVMDSHGKVVVDLSEPEVVRQVCDGKVARQLIDLALVKVIEEGTGKTAQIAGFKCYGKTGTAQLLDPTTHAVSSSHHAGSFLMGLPAQNPQLVALVVVNEPRAGGYYGGTIAAPAAKQILEQTASYLGISPTEPITPKSGAQLVVHGITN